MRNKKRITVHLFFRKHYKNQHSGGIQSCWKTLFHENTETTAENNVQYQDLKLNSNYEELKLPSVIDSQYQNTAI